METSATPEAMFFLENATAVRPGGEVALSLCFRPTSIFVAKVTRQMGGGGWRVTLQTERITGLAVAIGEKVTRRDGSKEAGWG